MLRAEVERLDGIVRDFLELARPPRLDPRPGDLDAAVRETVALLTPGLPNGPRLSVELGVPAPAVFDPAAIRQILHNLVRNAAEATGESGHVRIVTDTAGSRVFLAVEDDGPGIPPGELDKIFEFGFSTKPGGNGLGLPIVHRLVTEMGGSVAVAPRGEGGTVVRIMLPASPGSAR